MKKDKLLFLAIMVSLVVGYAIYDYRNEISQNLKMQEKAVLLNWNKDQIRSVKIEIQQADKADLETVVELEKKDAQAPELPGWFLKTPLVERARGQAVDDFVEGIVTEKSIETVVEAKEISKRKEISKNNPEDKPQLTEPDWTAFGLDKPLGQVTLKNNLGEVSVFTVGSIKNFQGDAFLRKGDEKKVYLVSSTWLKKIESKAIDFRDKHLIQVPNADFPLSAILSVKFKNSRGVEYNYELNKKQFKATVDKVKTADTKTENEVAKKTEQQTDAELDLWQVAGHNTWKIDQNKVRDTISFIGSLEAIEFITESKPTSAEMKTWGFDHPELELTVTMKDSLKGQKDWHGVFAAGKDQVHRVWLEATGKVVKISPADVQKLIAFNADAYRDRHEPFELDSSKVKTVELQILGANGRSENLASTEELAQKWIVHVKSLNLARFTELAELNTKKVGQLDFKDDKNEIVLQLSWSAVQNGFYNVKSSKFPLIIQVAESDMSIFLTDKTKTNENVKDSSADSSKVPNNNKLLDSGKVKK